MLELRNVDYETKDGGSRKKILDQLSLRIKPNTITVITGPNGSGKSTLAHIIMGIKKPTSGKVFFANRDITDQDITDRAKAGISLSFQQPVKLKGITIFELLSIASGELISPEQASSYLEQVGLSPDDYLSREVNDKLSGGELKRIEIATILARDAKIIIFDEPEAGIDLWSFTDLIKVFKGLHRKNPEKSLIIISHQERILKIADEIIILENGKIKRKGIPSELLPLISKGAKL